MRAVLRAALSTALAVGLAGCSLTIDPDGVKPPAKGPTLSLSTSTLTFTAAEGGASPAPQGVVVSNSGTGTLGTPVATVSYTSGGGWCTASVTGAAAPYTVSVQAVTGALAGGVYRANISIAVPGAASSPATVAVTFTVNPPAPAIALSSGGLTFGAPQGGANPAAQTVQVTNAGGGALAVPTTSIAYDAGAGWLAATVTGTAAPYTISVQPTVAGLAIGTYTATVTVSSAGASNTGQVTVTLNIGSATLPTIGLSTASLSFNALVGATPAAQTVTVSNFGAGTLAPPTAAIDYTSGAGGWLTATPSGTAAPYTISVRASAAGLAAGNYTASVSIQSAGASNTPRTITVSFAVGSPSQPTIGVSAQSLSFQAVQGGASPVAKTVTITNAGTGTLPAPVPSITYTSGAGWLSTSVTGSAAPYTLSVQPSTGTLVPGDYDAVVSLTSPGASNSPLTLAVHFTVASSSQPTLSVTPAALAFTAQLGTAPAPKTITVSNPGVGTLAAPTVTIAYGDGDAWLTATVSGTAAPYTITVRPDAALTAGSHSATLSIASAGAAGSPKAVQVTVDIGSATQPTLAVSPDTLLFSATAGGGVPLAQQVTVSNSGTGALAVPTAAIAYGDGSGWLTATVSGAAPPYVVSIRPTSVLAAGSHTATVTLSSTGASNTATIGVTFQVGSSTQPTIGLSTSGLTFNGRSGGAAPAAQTVHVSNTGTGSLALPTATIAYGDGSSWLGATVSGSAEPYTITVQVNPAGLVPGVHTATVAVASAGASNTPVSFSVRLNLIGVSGCIATASGHQVCGSGTSAGAGNSSAAAGHAVRVGMVQPGAQTSSAGPAGADHRIIRGIASPGATKP